ncbi:MAG: hypothetical protein K9L30_15160 [Desulfobacterales bacterium]|nr:hypothetical protein [Desulfobacterales bacterium]
MINTNNVYVLAMIIILSVTAPWIFISSAEAIQPSGIVFEIKNEPREHAFTIKVPKGWLMEGGIFRLLAHEIGGPLNATESKCDLTLKSDSLGHVYFKILPDIVYAHPGIGGGFFPVGSGYQGAEIKPFVDAPTFVAQVFAYLHPNAYIPKTLKIRRLAGEKQALDQGMAYMNRMLNSIGLQSNQSDVAGGVFEYMEGNTMYREVILSAVLNMPAALTWKNTRTLAFRAPAQEFDQWRPVMDIIRFSIHFNLNWLVKEFQGQDQLARKAADAFREMNRIDQEIVQKSNINRSEIMNDNFLALTGQEDFINPRTGDVETDTDAYRYRWKTPGGDMYYTNNEYEDPNIFLHQTGFELTPIRKRKNE